MNRAIEMPARLVWSQDGHFRSRFTANASDVRIQSRHIENGAKFQRWAGLS